MILKLFLGYFTCLYVFQSDQLISGQNHFKTSKPVSWNTQNTLIEWFKKLFIGQLTWFRWSTTLFPRVTSWLVHKTTLKPANQTSLANKTTFIGWIKAVFKQSSVDESKRQLQGIVRLILMHYRCKQSCLSVQWTGEGGAEGAKGAGGPGGQS